MRKFLMTVFVLFIFTKLYSQLSQPGYEVIVSDFGPRNLGSTKGRVFHPGIDYRCASNETRVALERGSISTRYGTTDVRFTLKVGRWGYMHCIYGDSPKNIFKVEVVDGSLFVYVRSAPPNQRTLHIYTDEIDPEEPTKRDQLTGQILQLEDAINAGEICFAPRAFTAGGGGHHLHLELPLESENVNPTENPLRFIRYTDQIPPKVEASFYYRNSQNKAEKIKSQDKLFGNPVIITAKVDVRGFANNSHANDIEKDLDIVRMMYKKNDNTSTFQELHSWVYTDGSLSSNNVANPKVQPGMNLSDEAYILSHLSNPIHNLIYPYTENASIDFFKYGWNTQEKLGTGVPKYRDGEYIVRVKGIDIRGRSNPDTDDKRVIIDNYKPYIQIVWIEEDGKIFYHGRWDISGNNLNFSLPVDGETKGNKNLLVKVMTSEPMKSLNIYFPQLDNLKASCECIDGTNKLWWKYELSKSKFNFCGDKLKKLNGKIKIEFSGLDLADNKIEGFGENETSKALSSLPLHAQNDKIEGLWTPGPKGETDKKHYIKLNVEPLTCSWTATLITPGFCWIPPVYLVKPTAKGGRPFESGDPYKFKPSFKIVTSPNETVTFEVEDQFCKETASGLVGSIPPGGCPKDPNDIIGPKGYGERQMVSIKESLPYKIRFENDPNAVSPAQKVVVTCPVDKNADMYSLELGEFGFGDFSFQVPPKSSNYSARLNVVDSLGVFVDVVAGLDIAKKELFWIFQTIDPKTGTKPFGFDLGFLPQNDSTHRGEGYVTFKINPIRTAQTGDTIFAQASIVFDREKSMSTNKVFNAIDAQPPITRVKPLPATIDSTQFRVAFTGADDKRGSGIAKYELFVSENKGAYYQYNTSSGDTSILFDGSMGNTYDFYTRSWDNVYNSEKNKGFAETSVMLKPKSIIISPNTNSHFCVGNKLKIIWRNTNIKAFDIELSDDNTKSFKAIASNVLTYDTIFETEIPANIDLAKNYCIRLVNSLNKIVIETSEPFKFYPKIKVNAGFDRLICNKDSVQIGGNPSALNGAEPYTYKWLTSIGLSSYNISNPYARYEDSYALEVHDAYGCWNRDTVVVTNSNSEKLVFYGLDEKYCLQASPVTLNATPIGGVFSGLGIVNNVFYPSTAGAGNHAITYTHTNSNGCKKDTTVYVEVLEQSKVILSDVLNDYCVDSDTVHLNPQPVGGIFSGDGVVGNHFVPLKAGAGLHRIKYTFSDVTGCVAVYEFDINVHSKPDLTVVGLENSYCVNSPIDTLRGVPVGGVFGGIGISNGIFNPAIAGAGSHQITYQYTSPYGCSNSIVTSTLVNSLPAVSISGLNDHYCENATPIALNGTPASGVFQGLGVNSGKFYPSTAGVGIHNIQYTYTDVNMCSNSAIQQVEVIKKPNVTFLGLDDSYCINSGVADLTGRPSGGRFSGNGIMGSTFNPSVAGIGIHFISYSYTASSGCSNDTSKSVKVNPLPHVYLGRDTSITTVEMLTLNAGNGFKNYKWSDGSTGQTLALSGAALGKGIHKFWVEVSDNNSCSATDTILVKVSDNVDIDIFNSLVKLQVYPNPSTGLFYLDIENGSSENIYVEVRNNAGQVVYSKKFKGRFEDIKAEINLLGKAKGVYYINVKVKQEQVTRKIVII